MTDAPFVVVGYDGSQGSETALRVAVQEARLRRARLVVVSAWLVPTYAYGSRAAPSAGLKLGEEVRQEMGRRLDGAVKGLRESAPDLDVESRLVEGSAARALVEGAAGAELLVVGSRGLGGFRELLLGSVSHQCAQHASCPLLIVPADGAPAR